MTFGKRTTLHVFILAFVYGNPLEIEGMVEDLS